MNNRGLPLDAAWQPRFEAGAQALRWTATYMVAALAWVLLAHFVVERLAHGEPVPPWMGLASGVAFVVLTGFALFLALSRLLARLAQIQLQWHQVVDAMPDAVWVASADRRRLLYLNRAARKAFEDQCRHLMEFPEDWEVLVHRDDHASLRAAWSAPGAEGAREITFRMLRPDGALRWLRFHFGTLRDGAGEVFATAGIATDVTEQVLARRREQDARRELRVIIDSAMDAIISVDGGQRIRVFNRAAAETFGVSEAAAIGQPLDRFIPPALRGAHREHVKAFMASGVSSRSMHKVAQLTGLRADQTEFPIEATIARSLEGGPPTMTVILRDATDVRRAEDAERRRVEAEASDRAKSEFLSRMSHEVRTPLNAVIGFTELMLTDHQHALPASQVQRLNHVKDAAWHLLAIVDDVLDLSRVETARLAVHLQAMTLQAAVGEAIALCQGLALRHGIAIFAPSQAEAAVHVRADPVRLRQVLVNLISNAIKYNEPEGGVIVSITRSAESGQVRVADSGDGMTPEQMQHLFEPFNRLGRERGGIEGTGIGLVLARQLTDLMRGRLEIHSEKGRGTQATISLPLAPEAPEPPAAVASAEPRTVEGVPATIAGTVLCIEDNLVNSRVIREFLRTLGQVRFLHADNGSSGIEMAARFTPDLVFLDMHLPDLDGLAVLRELRRRPALLEVPVIVLSADARPGLPEAATEAGATAFWTKPLDFEPARKVLLQLLGPAAA